jgi:hypothetical protein
MDIPRVESSGASMAVNPPSPTSDKDVQVRDVVTAVHEINRSDLMVKAGS